MGKSETTPPFWWRKFESEALCPPPRIRWHFNGQITPLAASSALTHEGKCACDLRPCEATPPGSPKYATVFVLASPQASD